MADDASAGVAHAGLKNNLLGERTAGARLEMIGDQEVVAATHEVVPATVDRELLGWQQPWLLSSFELRDNQSHVTRCVELLFLGKL